jgi:ribose 5-phosphate isomerase RpiB
MIFTQRQLELLHNGNGQIVLPYRARLTPLAQDWVRQRKISLGYADVQTTLTPKLGSSSPLPSESPVDAPRFLWWCDGPCGPAKAAIVTLAREANLGEMQSGSITEVVKELAGAVKNNVTGGVLVVKSGAVAMVLANRSPALRAVLGTCLDSVEQGIGQMAANVLVLEHPYVTLMQAKNVITRFIRAKRVLSDEMKRQMQEVATCA